MLRQDVPGRRNFTENKLVDTPCDQCTLLEKSVISNSFCIDCEYHLCANCSTVHKKSKVTKSHNVVFGYEVPPNISQSRKQSFCALHNDKPYEFFCTRHMQLLCPLCATTSHKLCELEYLDSIPKGYDKSAEFHGLRDTLSYLTRKAQAVKQNAIENKERTKTIHSAFYEDVKAYRDEIDKLLEQIQANTLHESKLARDDANTTSDFIVENCERLLKTLKEESSNLEAERKSMHQKRLVITAKMLTTKTDEWTREIGELQNKSKLREYKFKPDEKITQYLQSLPKLGFRKEDVLLAKNTILSNQTNFMQKTDKLKPKHISEQNPWSLTDPHMRTSTNHKSGRVTAKSLTQINVCDPGDGAVCNISGLAVIDDKLLAVVDSNNKAIKIVDTEKNAITSYFKVRMTPFDATCVDSKKIIMTCNEEKLIVLMIQSIISFDKEIKIDGKGIGIDSFENGIVVSFQYPKAAVKILTENGTVLREISGGRFDKSLFIKPTFVLVSSDKGHIFVSEEGLDKIIKLGLDGRRLKEYSNKDMKSVCGLAADERGNIFAAGWWTDNIHQITEQCSLSQILLDKKRGIGRPKAIAYCEKKRKLYVSQSNIFYQFKNKYLSVFKID